MGTCVRGRLKGNKEISLTRTVLEYAVRLGKISVNPFDGVEKPRTEPSTRPRSGGAAPRQCKA